MMRNNLKNTKGITLVALIVTIIVLLILATVTIKLLVDSGIVGHAKSATNKYVISKEEEQIKLAYSEYKMSNLDKKPDLEELDLLERYCLGENKEGLIPSDVRGTEGFKNSPLIPDASYKLTIVKDGNETVDFIYNGKEYRMTNKNWRTYSVELIFEPGTFKINGANIVGDNRKGWTITFNDTKNQYYLEQTGKVEKTPTAQEGEELLRKYFMETPGDTGTTIDLIDPETGNYKDNEILPDASTKLNEFCGMVSTGKLFSGNTYYEYKNKVYVVRVDGLVVKDVKFIYEKKGREGQTVRYSYDGTPENEKDWTILYDYGDSVEIISPDDLAQMTYLDIFDIETAIQKYNDTASLMNESINKFVTNPNKISVRCVGSNPENPLSVNEEMFSSDQLTQYNAQYNGKGRRTDTNYERDYIRMEYFKTAKITDGEYGVGCDYSMPSCNCVEGYTGINFSVIGIKSNGEASSNYVWLVNNKGDVLINKGFASCFIRPIVKIKY